MAAFVDVSRNGGPCVQDVHAVNFSRHGVGGRAFDAGRAGLSRTASDEDDVFSYVHVLTFVGHHTYDVQLVVLQRLVTLLPPHKDQI